LVVDPCLNPIVHGSATNPGGKTHFTKRVPSATCVPVKLPSYIEDEDIISKLQAKGIKLVSPVYRRAIPGTQVADGTRFVKCVFPPGFVALPCFCMASPLCVTLFSTSVTYKVWALSLDMFGRHTQ
jgi:hypothetical protein